MFGLFGLLDETMIQFMYIDRSAKTDKCEQARWEQGRRAAGMKVTRWYRPMESEIETDSAGGDKKSMLARVLMKMACVDIFIPVQ